MKAVLTDDQAPVYGSTEDQSITIAMIHRGEVMELGKVIRKGEKFFEKKLISGNLWIPKLNLSSSDKVWVEIFLPGGQIGYIPGSTTIFAIRKAALYSKTAEFRETPSKDGKIIKTLKNKALLTVMAIEKTDEGPWFKVTDENGVTGYLASTAKLREIPEYNKASAKKNIITGLIFLVIGAGLTFLYSRNQSGATIMLYIGYAVIFFGILQGGQGVMELIKSNKDKNSPKK